MLVIVSTPCKSALSRSSVLAVVFGSIAFARTRRPCDARATIASVRRRVRLSWSLQSPPRPKHRPLGFGARLARPWLTAARAPLTRATNSQPVPLGRPVCLGDPGCCLGDRQSVKIGERLMNPVPLKLPWISEGCKWLLFGTVFVTHVTSRLDRISWPGLIADRSVIFLPSVISAGCWNTKPHKRSTHCSRRVLLLFVCSFVAEAQPSCRREFSRARFVGTSGHFPVLGSAPWPGRFRPLTSPQVYQLSLPFFLSSFFFSSPSGRFPQVVIWRSTWHPGSIPALSGIFFSFGKSGDPVSRRTTPCVRRAIARRFATGLARLLAIMWAPLRCFSAGQDATLSFFSLLVFSLMRGRREAATLE